MADPPDVASAARARRDHQLTSRMIRGRRHPRASSGCFCRSGYSPTAARCAGRRAVRRRGRVSGTGQQHNPTDTPSRVAAMHRTSTAAGGTTATHADRIIPCAPIPTASIRAGPAAANVRSRASSGPPPMRTNHPRSAIHRIIRTTRAEPIARAAERLTTRSGTPTRTATATPASVAALPIQRNAMRQTRADVESPLTKPSGNGPLAPPSARAAVTPEAMRRMTVEMTRRPTPCTRPR